MFCVVEQSSIEQLQIGEGSGKALDPRLDEADDDFDVTRNAFNILDHTLAKGRVLDTLPDAIGRARLRRTAARKRDDLG